MHELGHNFGSWHTHDDQQYSPRVDTCGIGSCSSQFPLAKSATIMSYCHQCNGGLSNTAYTFGGKYKGTGSRSDPNSYNNSPLAGTVSFDPRRVNTKMWAHVSSRGTCTQPPTSSPTGTITIQAESYSNSFGVIPESTGDVGGGQNVGNINTGDWMSYPAVTIPTTGVYTVSYRVASLSGGGSLQLERAGGTPVYGTLGIPSTGAWQSWTTVSHTVTLSAGSLPFGIKATSGGWNINWFTITQGGNPPPTSPGSAKPTTRRPTSRLTTRRPTSKPTTAPPTLSGGIPTYYPTWFF